MISAWNRDESTIAAARLGQRAEATVVGLLVSFAYPTHGRMIPLGRARPGAPSNGSGKRSEGKAMQTATRNDSDRTAGSTSPPSHPDTDALLSELGVLYPVMTFAGAGDDRTADGRLGGAVQLLADPGRRGAAVRDGRAHHGRTAARLAGPQGETAAAPRPRGVASAQRRIWAGWRASKLKLARARALGYSATRRRCPARRYGYLRTSAPSVCGLVDSSA